MDHIHLKYIHCSEVVVDRWEPQNPEDVYISLELGIAPDSTGTPEAFSVLVATPKGLQRQIESETGLLVGRGALIYSKFSWVSLHRDLASIIQTCSARDWSEAASLLEQYFRRVDGRQGRVSVRRVPLAQDAGPLPDLEIQGLSTLPFETAVTTLLEIGTKHRAIRATAWDSSGTTDSSVFHQGTDLRDGVETLQFDPNHMERLLLTWDLVANGTKIRISLGVSRQLSQTFIEGQLYPEDLTMATRPEQAIRTISTHLHKVGETLGAFLLLVADEDDPLFMIPEYGLRSPYLLLFADPRYVPRLSSFLGVETTGLSLGWSRLESDATSGPSLGTTTRIGIQQNLAEDLLQQEAFGGHDSR